MATLFLQHHGIEPALLQRPGHGAVGQALAQALGAQLAEVYEIERLHAELAADSDAERQRKLSVLDQAAGQFRATAAFVRVSP